MDELELSRSHREIVALKAKYFRFVDTQQWDEIAKLFTDDARLFFPENQTEPGNVAESIAFFRHVLEGGRWKTGFTGAKKPPPASTC
jgi:hypothetical protein